LGVRGPKGIEVARRLGLGLILAEGSTPAYVADARRALGPDAHITVFVWSNLDTGDGEGGLEALRPTVDAALKKPYLTAQLGAIHGSACDLDVIRRLTVAGDVADCRSAIDKLADAGADSIVLQPIHGTEEQQIEIFGEEVRGRLALG
jgi:alkanesulfonate monooxygenase SsuD/methylene tetrahydromethanopterin reductase-like flavin-dependent oxidoreductase (luciferase family)